MCAFLHGCRSARERARPVCAVSRHTVPTTDPGRSSSAPLRSRDRLEKRGLSQSLIQPIPADLRAQIRTGEGDEEEEEGRHAHEALLLAPTGHVCGWWFVVSFLRDALDCNPRQFYTSPSPAMARRNQRSESVETGASSLEDGGVSLLGE